jgi:hypothetical protein
MDYDAPSIEAGLLHQVDFRLPAREFYVISHRERYRSRAAEALMRMVTGSAPPAELPAARLSNPRS